MNRPAIPTTGLFRFQRIFWYAVLIWFAAVCVAFPLHPEPAADISYWGVIFVLIMTGVRIVFLTELFRRARRTRFMLLGWLLLAVLALTVLYKFLR